MTMTISGSAATATGTTTSHDDESDDDVDDDNNNNNPYPRAILAQGVRRVVQSSVVSWIFASKALEDATLS